MGFYQLSPSPPLVSNSWWPTPTTCCETKKQLRRRFAFGAFVELVSRTHTATSAAEPSWWSPCPGYLLSSPTQFPRPQGYTTVGPLTFSLFCLQKKKILQNQKFRNIIGGTVSLPLHNWRLPIAEVAEKTQNTDVDEATGQIQNNIKEENDKN